MAASVSSIRIDQASRIIIATPKAIFQALTDAEALSSWRAPKGLTATFDRFEARPGGQYRMTMIYPPELSGQGKSGSNQDVVIGRFVELLPYDQIVEEVEFDSVDPAFAGTMRISTTLTPVAGGTKVTIACENVPDGIRPEDHAEGLAGTLKNLALFIE